MRRNGTIIIMAAILFSVSAQSKNIQPDLHNLWKNSTIVGIGNVLEVYDMAPIEGINHQCAMIEPEVVIKGNVKKNTKKICYRNALMVELGPGPVVKEGEEVIFFGLFLWDDVITLSTPDFGLVSPSNSKWTVPPWKTQIWSATSDFKTFKDAVIRVAAYESATYKMKGQIAEEFIRSDNQHLWALLHSYIIEKQKSSTVCMEYDYKIIVPELIARIHKPTDKFRLSALYLLQALNKVKEVNGRLKNEMMDSALHLMSDENLAVRTSAFRAAKSMTDLNSYDEKRFKTVNTDREDWAEKHHYDFGYAPDAPEQERAAALEKWKAWWKENRGKGRYDASEEKYERLEKWRDANKKLYKEGDKLYAENIIKRVERGELKLDSSNPFYKNHMKKLEAAGYEVTADGKIIKPSEAQKDEAVSGNANDSFFKRIGCTMSYSVENEDGKASMALAVFLILAFFMLILRRNE